MPARRGAGERRLEEALTALTRALDASGAPWMIIGGIAVIGRGVRRFTSDIDAVVRGDAIDAHALLAVLERHAVHPRIADAAAFAEQNLVLLLRHDKTGVDLDVSFGWSAFEEEAIAARKRASFGRVSVPMASAADLVVFKAIAGRPKDIEDAEALLVMHPRIDAARVRRKVAELAGLAGADEIVTAFDALLTRARGTRRGHATSKKKR